MRVRGGGLTGDWVQLVWPGDTRLVCRAKWPPPRRVCFLSRPATNNPLVGWLVGWCWTGPKTVRSIPRRPTTPVAETKLGFRPRPHEIIRKQIPLLQSSIPAFEIYTLTMYGPTALRYAVTMSAPAGYMKQDNFPR
jgi:hypothetical protein